MRRGVSFTMTTVIIGVIALSVAITIGIGGGDALRGLFGSVDATSPDLDCESRLAQVENGDLRYEVISRECRTSVSASRWQEIKERNLRRRSDDDIVSALTGGG